MQYSNAGSLLGLGKVWLSLKLDIYDLKLKISISLSIIIMLTIILARVKVMKSCSEYDVKVTKGDLEFARSTCDLNGDWCLGVEDPGCDGKPNFYICPKNAKLRDSSSSCFYFRGT